MNKKSFLGWGIAIAILVGGGFWLAFGDSGQSADKIDRFAQCLTEKGIAMYGTDQCPFCQSEKGAFGESFRFVSYINCTNQPNQCLGASIRLLPTWTFSDGRKLEGRQGLEKLSQESGCPLAR